MSVLYQYVHLQGWSLKFIYCWAKYKEKVPDVSDPNQNVDATYNSKPKFTELKDLFIKRVHKKLSNKSKDELYICSLTKQF